MNPDFVDFLNALLAVDARFLVVGAHAIAVHGVPRARDGSMILSVPSTLSSSASVVSASRGITEILFREERQTLRDHVNPRLAPCHFSSSTRATST